MLSHEIAFALSINAGHVDRLLPFMKPTTCDIAIWGDRKQHVHVIGHQMPFFDLRFLLTGKPSKHFAKMPA